MLALKILDFLIALGSGTTYTAPNPDRPGWAIDKRPPLWLRRAYVLTLPVSLPLLIAGLVLGCLIGIGEMVIRPTVNAINHNWRDYDA